MILDWNLPAIRSDELSRITIHNPDMYPGHRLDKIANDHIELTRVSDNEKVDVKADSVVLALGVRSNPIDLNELKAITPKVMVVGDALKGGRIATAVRQGYEAGYTFEA